MYDSINNDGFNGLIKNSVDPDQTTSSEAICFGSSLFSNQDISGFSDEVIILLYTVHLQATRYEYGWVHLSECKSVLGDPHLHYFHSQCVHTAITINSAAYRD